MAHVVARKDLPRLGTNKQTTAQAQVRRSDGARGGARKDLSRLGRCVRISLASDHKQTNHHSGTQAYLNLSRHFLPPPPRRRSSTGTASSAASTACSSTRRSTPK